YIRRAWDHATHDAGHGGRTAGGPRLVPAGRGLAGRPAPADGRGPPEPPGRPEEPGVHRAPLADAGGGARGPGRRGETVSAVQEYPQRLEFTQTTCDTTAPTERLEAPINLFRSGVMPRLCVWLLSGAALLAAVPAAARAD